jgi:Protein of unknown function (DUF1490)
MIVHGLMAKATSTVLTGTVGAVAYDLLRAVAAKAPIREAAVTTTAWGLRGVRKAEEGAESARLTIADVVAEAREQIGELAPTPGAAEVAEHDHVH